MIWSSLCVGGLVFPTFFDYLGHSKCQVVTSRELRRREKAAPSDKGGREKNGMLLNSLLMANYRGNWRIII